MIEMRATVQNFSEPTKKLDALITAGRIHHDGNPAFAWCVSNTVGHYDRKGNVYPTRESPEQCIDSSIALIMALGRAILNEGGSVYDSPDPEEIFV
jgi:phage terminase large subunit-like protein